MAKQKKSTKKYALLSVSDKTGIVDFAKNLHSLGYSLISTGGTANVLTDKKIPIIPIQEITGNPESFDGRMKTISFHIESGILFDRSNKNHISEAKKLDVKPIDVVVCNLYPFEQTIANSKTKIDDAIESIDVGGPTMIRAAAKNFKSVVVVVDPKDYEKTAEFLESAIKKLRHPEQSEGSLPKRDSSPSAPTFAKASAGGQNDIKRELAAKAFAHLSFYDSQIARFLSDETFPDEITLPGRKMKDLRYGENPHQQSAVYVHPNTNAPIARLEKLWGRELSLTNVADINAGIESVRLFTEPAAVIIKHNSPCGIALGSTPAAALERAIASDPESAFGGVIILNRSVDKKTAEKIGTFKDEKKSNIDILAAPTIEQSALSYLQTVRKSMGIYMFGQIPKKRSHTLNMKWVDGGFMLQVGDNAADDFKDWKIVTKKRPTTKQLSHMKIAWKFIMRIRSNAIIIVDKTIPMTRGIGSGQTSRLRSTKIALEQAKGHTKGAIMASDSFFPFDDSVQLAARDGISAIVQQGGSIQDQLSIDAADKAGIAMIFTGKRAFWH
jgi:phosphoribosylaminoimidazolecarboxamide formyltransferase / IMP cyclohydrolase